MYFVEKNKYHVGKPIYFIGKTIHFIGKAKPSAGNPIRFNGKTERVVEKSIYFIEKTMRDIAKTNRHAENPILSSASIKAAARRLGFAACGVAAAAPVSAERAARFRRWIAEGRHGTMDYLAGNIDKRLDPRRLFEGARTVVCVALNYFPEAPVGAPDGYTLARYAYGRDYHDVVRARLRTLMSALGLQEFADGRAFCDTAPIDERYWAVQAGIGWQGRNCQLIVPGAGSYFFLGELLLRHEADAYDHPLPPRCGNCRRCIEACPAAALSADGIDARRCLSYLTIEHRGPLPDVAGAQMGRCIYGCDRCAEACPWNRFASPSADAAFRPAAALCDMAPADWHTLTPERYRQLFKGSAVKRTKYEGLVRNIRAVAEVRRQSSPTAVPAHRQAGGTEK